MVKMDVVRTTGFFLRSEPTTCRITTFAYSAEIIYFHAETTFLFEKIMKEGNELEKYSKIELNSEIWEDEEEEDNSGIVSQNERLMKLVNKQREIIYELHKDLEKVKKDNTSLRMRLSKYESTDSFPSSQPSRANSPQSDSYSSPYEKGKLFPKISLKSSKDVPTASAHISSSDHEKSSSVSLSALNNYNKTTDIKARSLDRLSDMTRPKLLLNTKRSHRSSEEPGASSPVTSPILKDSQKERIQALRNKAIKTYSVSTESAERIDSIRSDNLSPLSLNTSSFRRPITKPTPFNSDSNISIDPKDNNSNKQDHFAEIEDELRQQFLDIKVGRANASSPRRKSISIVKPHGISSPKHSTNNLSSKSGKFHSDFRVVSENVLLQARSETNSPIIENKEANNFLAPTSNVPAYPTPARPTESPPPPPISSSSTTPRPDDKPSLPPRGLSEDNDSLSLQKTGSSDTRRSSFSTLKIPDSDICFTRRRSDSNRTWTVIDPHHSQSFDNDILAEIPTSKLDNSSQKSPGKLSSKGLLNSFSPISPFSKSKSHNHHPSSQVEKSTSNSKGSMLPLDTLYNNKLSFRLDESLVRYLRFELMKTSLASLSPDFDCIGLQFVVGVSASSHLASQWKDEVWSFTRSIGECRSFATSFVLDIGAPPFPTLDWFTNDSSVIQNELLRRSVDTYFRYIFQTDLTLEQRIKLLEFLSSDTLREYLHDVFFLPPEHAQKEGVLLKYIENSGLVSRYFYLKDNILYFAENRNSPVLGTIHLKDAQVNRYNANLPIFSIIDPPHEFLTGENYQSAFVIQEKQTETRTGTATVHVLLARDVEDQKSWLRAILRQVPGSTSPLNASPFSVLSSDFPGSSRYRDQSSPIRFYGKADSRPVSQEAILSQDISSSPSPVLPPSENVASYADDSLVSNLTMSPKLRDSMEQVPLENHREFEISDRVSELSFDSSTGSVLEIADTRRNQDAPEKHVPVIEIQSSRPSLEKTDQSTPVELLIDSHSQNSQNEEKRSRMKFWAFPHHKAETYEQISDTNIPVSETNVMLSPSSTTSAEPLQKHIVRKSGIFGLPLNEAVNISTQFNDSGLPIVVYRCIEYLESCRAEKEEGIYRLSGSASTIKHLKEQFNEGVDYDLLSSDEEFDVHVIAGLLKLYLRNLPTNLLDTSMHKLFELLPNVPNDSAALGEFCDVISKLPPENFALLDSLLHHLRRIIAFEKVNKMNIRNVCIVFSPTLNIPSDIFMMLILNYDHIFTDISRQTNGAQNESDSDVSDDNGEDNEFF